MNWRWKSFEQSMSARAKPYDARLQMTFWQKVRHFIQSPSSPLAFVGTLLILFLIGIVYQCVYNLDIISRHADLWMAGWGWVGLMLAISRASGAWRFETNVEHGILRLYPLNRREIVQIYRRQSIQELTGIAVIYLFGYGVLAAGMHATITAWLFVLIGAALQATVIAALSMLVIRSRLNADQVSACILMGGLILWFVMTFQFNQQHVVLSLLAYANPASWVGTLILDGLLRGMGSAGWLIVPLLVVMVSMPNSFRTIELLRAKGKFNKSQRIRGWFIDEETSPPMPGNADQCRQELSRELARSPSWREGGIIERMISRLLTPREHDLVEMRSFPLKPFTNSYLWMLFFLSLYLAVNSFFVPTSFLEFPVGRTIPKYYLIQFFVILLTCLGTLSLIIAKAVGLGGFMFDHNHDRSLKMTAQQQILPSIINTLPYNYWEITLVNLKVNTFMVLLLTGPALVVACSPFWVCVAHTLGKSIFHLPLSFVFIIWTVNLMFPASMMLRAFRWDWAYVISFIKTILGCFVVFFLGMGSLTLSLDTPGFWIESIFNMTLMVTVVGLLFYCGKRYCQGRRL